MRGLTLTQPWASLVAAGAKKIETRSWKHSYRGPIAIHAAKGFPAWAKEECMGKPFMGRLMMAGFSDTKELPLGAIVAVANLHLVGRIGRTSASQVYVHGQELPITDPDEIAFGDYTPGRYGWVLTNVGRLKTPIPCKGALSLWDVPADIQAEIRRQIG